MGVANYTSCTQCKIDYNESNNYRFCSSECQLTYIYCTELKGVKMSEIVTKPLTQQELMIQYMNDEQLKIDELPFETDPNLAYSKLEERIKLIENIAFEAKARAVRLTSKKREIDAKSGKTAYNKNSMPGSLADPREVKVRSKSEKKDLSKLDKIVGGFVALGNSDEEILAMIPPVHDRAEVWKSIGKARGDKKEKE